MSLALVPGGGTAPLRERAAEEIRAWMGRRKVSGVALANRINRSQSYVSRRLTGETAFDLDDIEAIARVLDFPLTQIVGGPGTKGGQVMQPSTGAYVHAKHRPATLRTRSSEVVPPSVLAA